MAQDQAAAPPPSSAVDPYADEEAILSLVRKKMTEWKRGREVFTRPAWRNILFYRGRQWIVFDRAVNQYRPVRNPRGWPQPVTNLFGSTLDAIISVLGRVEPTLNYAPATDEPEDRATADVAGRVIEVCEDEVAIRVNRQYLATVVALTGGGWIETGYDPDPIHGMRLLQHEQCVQCGAVQPTDQAQQCQACQGRLLMPAVDLATGEKIGEQVPIGKMYVDVVPLFEMFYDLSEPMWNKHRQCCRKKAVGVDEAKQRWTHLVDKIHPNVMGGEAEFYGHSLATLGPNMEGTSSSRSAWNTGAGQQLTNTQVTEEWFYSLPDETYPQGLLAVVVGEQHLGRAGPLPYTKRRDGGESQPFLNFVFFPQKLVPGSSWPKTVADDLASKATQHNRIEALIELSLMGMAAPAWLLPEGSNVVNLTGAPNQIIRYNPLGPSNAKPERIPGQGIAAGVLVFFETIRQAFEQLSATFDVIKGDRPAGISAGIALQILREQGMSQFAPMFILWESAWAEWSLQAIEIFRQFATEERLLKIKGRDGKWRVEKFMGADLQGRVNVIPEAMSAMPKSSLLERAELEQLAAMGVVNPVGDPEMRFKFLEAWGRTSLTPGMTVETENAIKENEVFERAAQNPALQQISPQDIEAMKILPPEQVYAGLSQAGVMLPRLRPAVDDHGIHSREHKNWLRSETARALPLPIQLLAEMHAAQHDQFGAAQMQAMIQARQGMNPAAGFLAPPPGAANPMNEGSSMKRMVGDAGEMADQLAGMGRQQ